MDIKDFYDKYYMDSDLCMALVDLKYVTVWKNSELLPNKFNIDDFHFPKFVYPEFSLEEDTVLKYKLKEDLTAAVHVHPLYEDTYPVYFLLTFYLPKQIQTFADHSGLTHFRRNVVRELRKDHNELLFQSGKLRKYEEYDEKAVLSIKKRTLNIYSVLLNYTEVSYYTSGNIEKQIYAIRQNIASFMKYVVMPLMYENNIKLECDIREQMYCEVDIERLIMVLSNLFLNAVQYNSKENKLIKFNLYKSRKDVIFEIFDNGDGMTEEQIKKAKSFELSNNEDEEKSHLGLLIARLFCENTGGNISISSTVNEGTLVRMAIPYKEPPTGVFHSPPMDTSYGLEDIRLLFSKAFDIPMDLFGDFL